MFSWIVHRFEIGILAELKLASVAELGKTTPQTAPTWASICVYYVSSVDFRLGQSWSDSVRPDKARQISCVKNLVWAVHGQFYWNTFAITFCWNPWWCIWLLLWLSQRLFLGSIFRGLPPDLPELRFHLLWHTHMSFIIFIDLYVSLSSRKILSCNLRQKQADLSRLVAISCGSN